MDCIGSVCSPVTPIDMQKLRTLHLQATEGQSIHAGCCMLRCCTRVRVAAQVIAEVTLEQDGDADFDRKLDALRREEALINEEAKEAAAFLKADIPVIQPGQVAAGTTNPIKKASLRNDLTICFCRDGGLGLLTLRWAMQPAP